MVWMYKVCFLVVVVVAAVVVVVVVVVTLFPPIVMSYIIHMNDYILLTCHKCT